MARLHSWGSGLRKEDAIVGTSLLVGLSNSKGGCGLAISLLTMEFLSDSEAENLDDPSRNKDPYFSDPEVTGRNWPEPGGLEPNGRGLGRGALPDGKADGPEAGPGLGTEGSAGVGTAGGLGFGSDLN